MGARASDSAAWLPSRTWFASAYNITPADFAGARSRLDGHLVAAGRDATTFADTIAMAWLYVTENTDEARRVVEKVLRRCGNPSQ